MKKRMSALALLLCIFMTVLSGCGLGGNEKYRVVETLAEQEFCVAFRQGDKAGEAVIAALKTLQASGEVTELSDKWFGEDRSLLKGDESALDAYTDGLEKRTFIIGYDAGRLPFSGDNAAGMPVGFDVELARLVCQTLGWRAKFLPIDVSQAKVELGSGNVDCVWGGFAYDEDNGALQQSPVYMANTIVLASLAGSGVRSVGGLSRKTLTLSENADFNAVLEANKALQTKPGYIVKVPGGTDACFKALEDGSCAAIITDLAALDYYK
ncbi:MAG: transporter substrate-binding domain-containing protein [Bacillota bacterium]